MATRTAARRPPDSYFALVERFPLRHIGDAAGLAEAQGWLDRLLAEDLDEGGRLYLDALTDLVEWYEARHEPIPEASEAEVLRELMRSHGLGQAALAKRSGIAQSTLSAVLTGARSLTKAQVVGLSKLFGVSPSAFLPR